MAFQFFFLCQSCKSVLFTCIQLVVSALPGNELVMSAALYDAALFHYHDAVRIFNR